MFFINIDIDLLHKLNKNNKIKNENQNTEELFHNISPQEELLIKKTLLLSELIPLFMLLSYCFSIISKYLFNYQKQLQKELIQKIKDNPKLQKKIDDFIHKINKRWNKLNKKLNLVLTKGFTFLYNLALFLLGIEILVIYLGFVFYIFYVFFKGIKDEFTKIVTYYQYQYKFNPCQYNPYQYNPYKYNTCNPYSFNHNDICSNYPYSYRYHCPRQSCDKDILDDYYMYNEYDDYYDDYYDNGLYN